MAAVGCVDLLFAPSESNRIINFSSRTEKPCNYFLTTPPPHPSFAKSPNEYGPYAYCSLGKAVDAHICATSQMHRKLKKTQYGTKNLSKGAKNGVQVFADIHNFACVRTACTAFPIMHKYPKNQSYVGSSGQTLTPNVPMTLCDWHITHVLCGCTTFGTESK